MKDIHDMTSEERMAYYEKLQSYQSNVDMHVRLLAGCKNRLCVSDDKEELVRMFASAVNHLKCIFDLNVQRIDFASLLGEK